MTLIVVVEEERDAQAIGETLASLMHEHPSRAIVLRVRAGEEPSPVGACLRAMLDAVRQPAADLLRAGGDHQQSCEFRGCAVGAARPRGA